MASRSGRGGSVCPVMSHSVQRAAAFGAPAFAASAINNVFVTFYIGMFMLAAPITPAYFFAGQAVFMFWNAVNDPLLGWFSDRYGFATHKRTSALRLGGAIWAAAFGAMWFPWGSSPLAGGLHFVLCLCAYDGGLTYVEVNHAALLAEITPSAAERARANAWAAAFAGLGSLSSYAGHVLWDPRDLHGFRSLTIVLSLGAALTFELSGRALRSLGADAVSGAQRVISPHRGGGGGGGGGGPRELPGVGCDDDGGGRGGASAAPPPPPAVALRLVDFIRELLAARNFAVYSCVSFLQVFDCTLEKNFFPIFLELLVGSHASLELRGAIVAASFLAPHLCTIAATPIVERLGVCAVFHGIFKLRLALLAMAVLAGGYSWQSVCLCLFANRVLAECVCRLSPLVVSDLVDEDCKTHPHRQALSAALAGAASFFSKFAQSLAPMLGYFAVSWIRQSAGDGAVAAAAAVGGAAPDLAGADWTMGPLRAAVWAFVTWVPICVVIVQELLWRLQTLPGGPPASGGGGFGGGWKSENADVANVAAAV